MTNALIQNIAKAKGFDQDEQLILQIALGGILGGNNSGGGLGMGMGSSYPYNRRNSDPWMGMIMTLAGLLLAQKAMQKASVAQSLNPRNGTPTIGQSALSLAKMLTSSPPSNSSSPTQNQNPLQQAQTSLTNPNSQNLQNSNNTLSALQSLSQVIQKIL